MRNLFFPKVSALAVVLTTGLILTTGCGEPQAAVASAHGSNVADGSFDVGTPDRYRTERIYPTYAESHGVYLVSAHGMLVALAAECTSEKHEPAQVRWEPEVGVFRCPVCSAKYTRDGLNRGTSQSQRALERCRIRPSGNIYDRDTTLIVDPGKRFCQEDQEWSKPTSYYPLKEIIRDQRAKENIRLENARLMELPPLQRHKQ